MFGLNLRSIHWESGIISIQWFSKNIHLLFSEKKLQKIVERSYLWSTYENTLTQFMFMADKFCNEMFGVSLNKKSLKYSPKIYKFTVVKWIL